MNSTELTIERAERKDVPLLVDLIFELAEYEKLKNEVSVSVKGLEENLFSNKPAAEAIVLRIKGEPIGFAIYFFNFSTFLGKPGLHLEDLFIRPQFRSQGFGEAVFIYLKKLAIAKNCGRMEWSVLDWNNRAIDFYKRLGATPLSDWTNYRLNLDSNQK